MKVLFPADTGQRYYNIHFRSVLNVLQYCGADITLDVISTNADLLFFCRIDDRWIGFDFSDAGLWRAPSSIPIFKFHHRRDERFANVYPFSPVSFYDWEQFDLLRRQVVYDPAGRATIAMRQRPHGNAERRRSDVMARLSAAYGQRFAGSQLSQTEFWHDVGQVRLSVCVPGQNNNMLDRGQLQYMAFGAATVSPELPEVLPFWEVLDGCYVSCSDSYDDLCSVIDGAGDETLREVGRKAAALFARTSTPERLVEWIDRCLRQDQG